MGNACHGCLSKWSSSKNSTYNKVKHERNSLDQTDTEGPHHQLHYQHELQTLKQPTPHVQHHVVEDVEDGENIPVTSQAPADETKGVESLRMVEKMAMVIESNFTGQPDYEQIFGGKISPSSIQVLFDDIGSQGAAILSRALQRNTTVKDVELGINNIGDEGAISIATALKANHNLRSLSLWGNSIRDSGARAIAEAITNHPSLTSLTLNNNEFGDDGLTAIAEALKHNKSIQMLDMSVNSSVGDQSVIQLSEALKVNRSLTHLNLSSDSIGNNGAAALADCLANSQCTLEQLDISFNLIGDRGVNSFVEAMRKNKILKEINLCGNMFTEEIRAALVKASQENPVAGRVVQMEEQEDAAIF